MAVESELRLRAVDLITGPLKRIGHSFKNLENRLTKINQRIGAFERKWGDVHRMLKRSGHAIKGVGRSLTTFFTLPAIAGGLGAINSFRKFERGLVGVGKTTDTEGKSLDKLGEKFLDLSTKIPLSAVELLRLGEVAGQLSVPANEVAGFSEVLGKLQFSTDVVGEDGAKAIARILNLTGEGTKVINEFGAALVDLGNTAAASESEIVAVAIRVAGNISRFKVTSSEILAISTTLRELGKESELSGSAIGRGFLAIEQAVLNGKEPLKALQTILSTSDRFGGLNRKDLKKSFFETPAAVFQEFIKGLNKIETSGGNTTKILKLFGLEGVRINDIYGTLITNTKLLDDRFKQANEQFRKSGKTLNALDTEANRAFATLDAKIKMTLATIVKFGIILGKKLKPFVLKFLEIVRDSMKFLIDNPKFTKFMSIVVGLIAVIGPLIMMIGSIVLAATTAFAVVSILGISLAGLAGISLAVLGVLGSLAWAFYELTQHGWDFKKLLGPLLALLVPLTFMFGPIAIVIAAVTTAVGAAIVYWDEFVTLLKEAWEWLKKIANYAGSSLLFGKDNLIKPGFGNFGQSFNQIERSIVRDAPNNPNKNSTSLDINLTAPPGYHAEVTKQYGFDVLNFNRGTQGAF